ncbi:MAG: heme biosynthesis HemY N-terminal domain-containing protein [Porticoccaceae bacterium]
MRQLLLVTLGALLLGAGAIWLMQQDQGYILISLGTLSIEMSFWLGAIIFVAASGLFIWLLLFFKWLLGAGGVRQWWLARRSIKQTGKTAKGLMDFLSGDWSMAERVLAQSIKDPALTRVSLLFAAKAAANNGQIQQAKQLLKQFVSQFPSDKEYAELLLAEMLIQATEIDRAQEILEAIKVENKMSLRLLADLYCLQSNWSALSALIPKIKRQSVFDKHALEALQVTCYRGCLNISDHSMTTVVRRQKIEAVWSDIPRAFRHFPEIIAAYVDALASADAPEKALNILAKALKNQWHQCLLEAYGRLEIKDGSKQLALGEKWLVKYPQDPLLLLALGLICRRMGFLGKAKDYMKSTIELAPSAQAYNELAAVLELLGDSKSSSEVYKKGLRFATQ